MRPGGGASRPARIIAALALIPLGWYLSIATAAFRGALLDAEGTPESSARAAVLESANAEHEYRQGLLLFAARQDAAGAIPHLRRAVQLNRAAVPAWVQLTRALVVTGDVEGAQRAADEASRAAPRDLPLKKERATVLLVLGQTADGLAEYRTFLDNSADLVAREEVLGVLRRAVPDTDYLLHQGVPPRADVLARLLRLYTQDSQMAAAHSVWQELVALQRPTDERAVSAYVTRLLDFHQVDQALAVWKQAGPIVPELQPYTSPHDLLVDGRFSLPIINLPFGWRLEPRPGVAVKLDDDELHEGHPVMRIAYDDSDAEEAGLYQIVPARAGERYQFKAAIKAADLLGAGGPRFVITDAYSGHKLAETETVNQSGGWRDQAVFFTVPPETHLLRLRLVRSAPTRIRGRVWIDAVQLLPAEGQAGS